jgi:hypothetical protein
LLKILLTKVHQHSSTILYHKNTEEMKKIIMLCAALLSIASTSNASHLMGGDIKIYKTSGGQHHIKVNLFRDMFGIPAAAYTSYIIERQDSASLMWFPVGNPFYSSLLMDSASTFQLTGIPYGVESYNYIDSSSSLDSVFTLYGAGKYRVVLTECCRNYAILNLTSAGSESFGLTCEYTYDATSGYANSSPEFLSIPVIYGPINLPWVYNPLPFDADGDSLVWSVFVPMGANNVQCLGYSTPPSTATGPFTLNSANGQLDWTPSMTGNYVASFLIEEYRNGVLIGSTVRDMQYVVIADSIPDSNGYGYRLPRFAPSSNYSSGTNNSGSAYSYIYFHAGHALSFSILADDANTTDVVTMSAFSSLLQPGASNATFNFAPTGVGNQVKGTFNWTPTADDKESKLLVIRANDGTFNLDFSLTLKPQEVSLANGNLQSLGNDVVVYPNPATDGAVRFSINNTQELQAVTATILDVTGKVVANYPLGKVNAGTNVFQVSKVFNTGNYLLRVTSGNQVIKSSQFSVR